MTIAVDAMGGDYAPGAVVEGALAAAREDGIEVLLVGREEAMRAEVDRCGGLPAGVETVHAEEVVTMDDSPIAPIRRKRRSSIRVCGELVREGRAAAMVSAGNTGAAMIVAKMVVGTVPGVDRPALAAVLPTPVGRTVLLDVGANVDTKPAHLREFAVMGHFFAQEVLGTERPRVGLLSIGEEEGKGDDLTRAVYKVLQELGLHFVGNVEGRDVFGGTVDVVVCDGFVGNAILKSAESLAEFVRGVLRQELSRSLRSRLGYLLARPAFDALRARTDYSEYGAAPLLGVEGGCFIGHGRSNPRAVHSAIRRAEEFARADLAAKIRLKIAELHRQEERILEPGDREEVPT